MSSVPCDKHIFVYGVPKVEFQNIYYINSYADAGRLFIILLHYPTTVYVPRDIFGGEAVVATDSEEATC